MATQNTKGFTACGQYYRMGDYEDSYIEYCVKLIKQIRRNYVNRTIIKNNKPHEINTF